MDVPVMNPPKSVSGGDRWIYQRLWNLVNLDRPLQSWPDLTADAFRRFLSVARMQGVLGIALEQLIRTPAGLAHPEIWTLARHDWQNHVVQSLRVRHHASKVLTDFSSADIPAVVIKGIDFADTLYPASRFRVTLDLDILVPREQWPKAGGILEATGHVHKRIQPPMFLPSGVVSQHSWLSASHIDVDLHWSMVHFPSHRRQAAIGYWDLDWQMIRSVGTDGSSREMPTLSAPSRLVLAAVHTVYHHQFERLIELVDLKQACHRLQGDADIWRTRALAERTGTLMALNLALQVAARFLEDPKLEQMRQQILAAGYKVQFERIPVALFEDAAVNFSSIRLSFDSLGRRRIRSWLARQPMRPEPGREFEPSPGFPVLPLATTPVPPAVNLAVERRSP